MKGLAKIANVQEEKSFHKLAWTNRQIQKARQEFVDSIGNPMSDEDFINLKQKIYNENNLRPKFMYTNDPLESKYIPPESIEIARNRDPISSRGLPNEGLIMSAPHKEVFLHEVGHAVDPDVFKDLKKGQNLNIAGQNVGMYGGLAAPSVYNAVDGEEESSKTNQLLAGLGAGAAGAGLAYYGGKKIEGTEDRANNFVKQQLSNELGSQELGEQAFKNSPLQKARKTYTLATKANTKNALIGGLVGTGLGLGLANLKKDEEIQ